MPGTTNPTQKWQIMRGNKTKHRQRDADVPPLNWNLPGASALAAGATRAGCAGRVCDLSDLLHPSSHVSRPADRGPWDPGSP